MKLPPKIRKVLAATLHEWELQGIERMTFGERCDFMRDCVVDAGETLNDEEERHISVLEQGVRELLAAGHADAAVQVAIKLGEVEAQHELNNDIRSAYMERGQREAEAIQEAALRRWGPKEMRQQIDNEIFDLVQEVIEAGEHSGAKQIQHEVARRMSKRHPTLNISPRKIRRAVTGH